MSQQAPLGFIFNTTTTSPFDTPVSILPYDTSLNTTGLPSTNPELRVLSPFQQFLVSLGTSDDEENLRRWSSFIGILIAVAGNILISLALNVQKLAHTRLEREAALRSQPTSPTTSAPTSPASDHYPPSSDDDDEADTLPNSPTTPLLGRGHEKPPPVKKNPYLTSPFWWLGLILMTFGECGNFLAYGFAPASIISPLGVVALIANCVVAPLMLHEPFRRRDFAGVVVSIAGAVTVVSSADKEETKLGPDELMRAVMQPEFYIYMAITVFLIVVLTMLSRKYGRKTILIDLSLVALYGAYTVLCTKAISSLISTSFYRIFVYPIAYPTITILALTAILQVKYVNRALQRFDSTMVIPTQFVLFTISVILGSAVLYGDFETVTGWKLARFCAGCCLTFVGVWLISSKRKTREDGMFAAVPENGERAAEEGRSGMENGVDGQLGATARDIVGRGGMSGDSQAGSVNIVHITGYQLSGVLAEAGGRRGSVTGPGLGTVVMEYVQGKRKKRKAVSIVDAEVRGAERRRLE